MSAYGEPLIRRFQSTELFQQRVVWLIAAWERCMAWFKKPEKIRTAPVETKGAEIKRRAAELQTLAGKGVPTGEAVTALAAALGNEICRFSNA